MKNHFKNSLSELSILYFFLINHEFKWPEQLNVKVLFNTDYGFLAI